jgi:rubrerythrin
VEKQVAPRQLQHCIQEEKGNEEIRHSHEAYRKKLDEKSIMLVHICYRCGRKFPFKKRRKRCPYCQGLLRTNTMILKVPQF